MMATSSSESVVAILGAQWGDEGKGKLVDLLAQHVHLVARCQGGNNAGHTVKTGAATFDFHLLPSGIVWPECVALIGNGVVVHLPNLFEEIERNEEKGLHAVEKRLKISDRAHLVFDLHQAVDGLQESLRSNRKLGTTKKGIGPTYASKANRSGIRVADLIGDFDLFSKKFRSLAESFVGQFTSLSVDVEQELASYRGYADRIRPMVVESVDFIHKTIREGQKVLVEGANAAMLDIDFGTYPYVTSSNCSVGGVCTGLGLPPRLLGNVYGVAKAYTTRVGDGPFPSEQLNEIGEYLQQRGCEFGVTTGRPRRCGWLDLMVLKFTSMVNGYDAIALTKLDVLDELETIKVAVGYKDKKGKDLESLPTSSQTLEEVEVVYEQLKGWRTSIQHCRCYNELPEEAKTYVELVEKFLKVPVRWIGVGAEREAIIEKQPSSTS